MKWNRSKSKSVFPSFLSPLSSLNDTGVGRVSEEEEAGEGEKEEKGGGEGGGGGK